MIRMKTLLVAASIALAGSSLVTTPASAQRYRHHDHHRYDRRHYDRRHHYRHHDNGGSTLAAGALGFILGAAIADTQSHRDYARGHMSDQAWLSHCESKYRSFDRGSGTYLGYDGDRHYCQ
jgi:hypothetical protein